MNTQRTLTTCVRFEIMPLSLVCFQNVIPRHGRVRASSEPLMTFPLSGGHKEDDNGLSGRFSSSRQTLRLKVTIASLMQRWRKESLTQPTETSLAFSTPQAASLPKLIAKGRWYKELRTESDGSTEDEKAHQR